MVLIRGSSLFLRPLRCRSSRRRSCAIPYGHRANQESKRIVARLLCGKTSRRGTKRSGPREKYLRDRWIVCVRLGCIRGGHSFRNQIESQENLVGGACGSYNVICVDIDLYRFGSCPHYIGGGGGRRTTPQVGQATPSLQRIFCDSGLSPKTTPP
jgi:hypothetical protein